MNLRKGAAVIAAIVIWIFTPYPESRADELTYYAYPSPLGIHWESPAALGWSTVFNHLVNDPRFDQLHAIGHINFALECDPSPELPSGARRVTGQTNSDDDEMKSKLLDEGYGLGEVLSSYKGRWESEEEIEKDLPARFATGRIAFLQFKISPSTCARVVQYLQEYAQRGFDKIYGGLQDRPRYGEGGGCIAFGESVLEIAGLLAPEWRQAWRREINIPNELIGGPMTGREVSVFEVLFGSAAGSWSPDAADAYPLTFSDPELTYHWIRRAWKTPLPVTGFEYTPMKIQRARGLRIDASNVPTPQEGFWLGSP